MITVIYSSLPVLSLCLCSFRTAAIIILIYLIWDIDRANVWFLLLLILIGAGGLASYHINVENLLSTTANNKPMTLYIVCASVLFLAYKHGFVRNRNIEKKRHILLLVYGLLQVSIQFIDNIFQLLYKIHKSSYRSLIFDAWTRVSDSYSLNLNLIVIVGYEYLYDYAKQGLILES